MTSIFEQVAGLSLSRAERAALLEDFPAVAAAMARRDWLTIRRPQQVEPDGAWSVWLIVTGRGWGKTRTAAEWSVRRAQEIAAQTGAPTRWALVAQTFTDGRDVMVEGESGLLR